jgi:hypothetical protein
MLGIVGFDTAAPEIMRGFACGPGEVYHCGQRHARARCQGGHRGAMPKYSDFQLGQTIIVHTIMPLAVAFKLLLA